MERKDNTAWIVIQTPTGETRVIEATSYSVVTGIKDSGEAIRQARGNMTSVSGDKGGEE